MWEEKEEREGQAPAVLKHLLNEGYLRNAVLRYSTFRWWFPQETSAERDKQTFEPFRGFLRFFC